MCSCSHPAKVKGHCMNHLYAGKRSIHAAHWAPYGTGLIDFRREMTEKTLRFRVWSHLIRKFSFLGAPATWDPSSFSWKKQISLEGNVHLCRLFSFWRRTSLPTNHRSSLMEPSFQPYHLRKVSALDITSMWTRGASYYWRPKAWIWSGAQKSFITFLRGRTGKSYNIVIPPSSLHPDQ